MGAVDEILDWSATKLTPWRQDALRRLAGSTAVTPQDESELLDLIKEKAGFSLAAKPPTPTPLNKAHLASVSSGSPLQIKGIRNVKNVNRLVPAAALPFTPNGMTIVYGRNGSGKSGFVRIFRTAPSVPTMMRHRAPGSLPLRALKDHHCHAYAVSLLPDGWRVRCRHKRRPQADGCAGTGRAIA